MLAYPADFKKDGKFILVTFADIPEVVTQGNNETHALKMAAEGLELAMDFYFDDRRAFPMPSKPKRGQRVVELPVSVSAKILLLNEMIEQGIRPAELARRLKTTPQEVNRLTNIRHHSKIDRVAGAMKVLGKRLEVRVV